MNQADFYQIYLSGSIGLGPGRLMVFRPGVPDLLTIMFKKAVGRLFDFLRPLALRNLVCNYSLYWQPAGTFQGALERGGGFPNLNTRVSARPLRSSCTSVHPLLNHLCTRIQCESASVTQISQAKRDRRYTEMSTRLLCYGSW